MWKGFIAEFPLKIRYLKLDFFEKISCKSNLMMQDLVKTWATVWEFSFSASQNYSQRHQRCSHLCNLEVGKSEFCAEQEEEWGHNILVLLYRRQEYLLWVRSRWAQQSKERCSWEKDIEAFNRAQEVLCQKCSVFIFTSPHLYTLYAAQKLS